MKEGWIPLEIESKKPTISLAERTDVDVRKLAVLTACDAAEKSLHILNNYCRLTGDILRPGLSAMSSFVVSNEMHPLYLDKDPLIKAINAARACAEDPTAENILNAETAAKKAKIVRSKAALSPAKRDCNSQNSMSAIGMELAADAAYGTAKLTVWAAGAKGEIPNEKEVVTQSLIIIGDAWNALAHFYPGGKQAKEITEIQNRLEPYESKSGPFGSWLFAERDPALA